MKKLILFVFLAFAGIQIANAQQTVEARAKGTVTRINGQIKESAPELVLSEEQKEKVLAHYLKYFEDMDKAAGDKDAQRAINKAANDKIDNTILTPEQVKARADYFKAKRAEAQNK